MTRGSIVALEGTLSDGLCIPGQLYDDLVDEAEDIAEENPAEEED